MSDPAAPGETPPPSPRDDALDEATPTTPEVSKANEPADRPPAGGQTAPAPAPVPEPPMVAITIRGSQRWQRVGGLLGILLLLGLLIWLAAQVRTVTVPLLVSFAIAYILDPLVDRFERRGIGRTVAIVVILLVGLLVLTLGVLLLGPQIGEELALLPDTLKRLVEGAIPWVERVVDFDVPDNVAGLLDALAARIADIDVKALAAPVGSVAKVLYGGTVGVIGAIAGVVMVPIFTFYLLRDFDALVARLGGLVPHHYRVGVGARFREIDHALSQFVRGQLVVASILAVLYSVGLWVVGIPLALVVGILSGLGNMIPYLGTTVGVLLATLLGILDWGGWGQLLGIWAVFVAVQTLEGYVITPKIVGESVGLSPFAVIVAVLVFGDLFGFFGILVAVPLAAVLKILLRVAVAQYKASRFFQAA